MGGGAELIRRARELAEGLPVKFLEIRNGGKHPKAVYLYRGT
jgi:hypothetical protein